MVAEETEFPREALGWLESGGTFDLVLLDMQMPEMDGASLGAAIQALKLQKQPELVMLTSSGMKEAETAGLKLAAYLTKPIKPAILYSTLLDVFGTEFGQADAKEGVATLATPVAAADRESFTAEAGTFLRQARILLAEDNLVNKQVALLLLKRIGLRADTAGNGLEALESLKRQSYDIVLMDVQMPELDGLEATRRIRAGHRDYGRPYIIAMTANAMQGDREICLSAGMDDYIGKPVRIDELSGALSRAEASLDYAPRNSDAAAAAPAAAPRPQSSSLDPATLEALRQTVGADDPDALAMLADDFILETEASLAAMKAGGDASAIARAAHSVKSSATLFGATALSALCADLEARLRGPEADVDLPGTVLAIDTEFERVRKELPEAIASLS
jgi:CheY-like chemotaxis protein